MPQKRKLLLIGWDAADWQIARPLMEQGKMPNLSRLCEQGVSGRLATIRPVLSPMLWTSIATGKRPYKHGIHGFSEPCPFSGQIRPITNLSRKCKAIWNILNQRDYRSNVIGWWPSNPAEPIDGAMVSNQFQSSRRDESGKWHVPPGAIHPKELITPLSELLFTPGDLGPADILPFIPKALELDGQKDNRMASCAKILTENSLIHGAATAVMQYEDWDFTAVYYDGIDHWGHGFMSFHPPKLDWVSEEDFEIYQNVMQTAYCFHDMMLGTLMALAGEDTTIMLISDHGFEASNLRPQYVPNEPAGPAAEHSPFGIFCLKGPSIAKGETISGASLLDITPTLLHLFDLPVGRDMDGKVLLNCWQEPTSIELVDSWEEVPGKDGRHPPETRLDADQSRAPLEQLVELGYIDEPSEDAQVTIDNTVRELNYNLAQAYVDGGDVASALKLYKKLGDRWPEESRFNLGSLNCLLKLGDAVGARAAFDRMIELKKARAPEAKKELKELIEKWKAEHGKTEPSDPNKKKAFARKRQRLQGQATFDQDAVQFMDASVMILEKRYTEALDILNGLNDIPDHRRVGLLSKIGNIYLEQESPNEAEQAFRKIFSITNQHPGAYLGLAQCHYKKSSYFESCANARNAIELDFLQPRAHYIYGSSLIQLEQYELAEQTLLNAVAQSPNYANAHARLSVLYRKHLKRPALAQKHALIAETIQSAKQVGRFDVPAPEAAPVGEFPSIAAKKARNDAEMESPLIVVSGLPRSGTSLMMQMLEAGGVKLYVDLKRAADASNPKGYFEQERTKKLMKERDRLWLKKAQGQGIKIVAPLLATLPLKLPTKVIFMERDAAEVLASQRKMLERDGKKGAEIEAQALGAAYAMQLHAMNRWLTNHERCDVLPISYAEAVEQPENTARKVVEFLGLNLDVAAMQGTADPTLYRERK